MTFPPLAPLPTGNGTRFRVVSRRRPRLLLDGHAIDAEDRGDYWEVFAEGVGAGAEYNWAIDETPLLDPCALAVRNGRCVVVAPPDPVEWRRPATKLQDSVIYELHVRGYTVHPSSGCAYPGTYRGLTERIDYLKDLGITAVELMPVHEFSTLDKGHPNFWGYSPIAWFAPHGGYAAEDAITEFRAMVRAFHAAGIQVIVDVVFNHTAELDAAGPTLHFRVLDPKRYYIDEERTGCGNTINTNDPVVQNLVLDCLRWWHGTLGVDGFRFDLASVLSRAPELIGRIEEDPALAGAHLIAEAWDAAGRYEVGSWPGGPRWAVWNDRFRDDVRHAWKGHPDMAPVVARRLSGSSDLFDTGPARGINYVACHDGLTLKDLGIDRRNLIASLLLAQGVPMLLAGDEFGRTQGGNANAYDQDNEISWVDWTMRERDAEFQAFVRGLIRLRNEVHTRFLTDDGGGRWCAPDGGEVDWGSGAFVYFRGELVVLVNLTDTHVPFTPPKNWRVVLDTGAPGILAACPQSPRS